MNDLANAYSNLSVQINFHLCILFQKMPRKIGIKLGINFAFKLLSPLSLQLAEHSPGGVVTIAMVARMVAPHSRSSIPPTAYEDARIVILVYGHGVAALRLVQIKLDHRHRRPPKIIIRTWTMHTVQLMRHCTQNWIANRYVRQIRHIKIRPTVSVVR